MMWPLQSGEVPPIEINRSTQVNPTMNNGQIWLQSTLRLPPFRRGFHLITTHVLEACPEICSLSIGLLQVFIQHTSASLTLNENADPDVRVDLEMAMSRAVPENWPYVHTLEGSDDMPAHVKNSLLGASVMIPITDGRPCLGTWQGIYLCEHRDRAAGRSLVLTAFGQGRSQA
jgi:secondary thiamine-phosphate synthase enzyme